MEKPFLNVGELRQRSNLQNVAKTKTKREIDFHGNSRKVQHVHNMHCCLSVTGVCIVFASFTHYFGSGSIR